MKDFNYLKQQMLYHKIVKWEENTIVLDNGLTKSPIYDTITKK